MPKRSSFASAYSRHSARTSQPEQMRLASRVEPPFSGKNASGSVWAHSARSCQSGSSAALAHLDRDQRLAQEVHRDRLDRLMRRTDQRQRFHDQVHSPTSPCTGE